MVKVPESAKLHPKGQISRINLGTTTLKGALPVGDLSAIQCASFRNLLEDGLQEVLDDTNPIFDYTEKKYRLDLLNLHVGKPKYEPQEALQKGVSYEAPIMAMGRLVDLESQDKIEQEVYLGDLPLITERGTFIVNGNERVVVNQLTRAPGVYFEAELDPVLKKNLYTTEVRPERGSWVGFEISKENVIYVRINRAGRRIVATTFLKAFGIKQREITDTLSSADSDPSFSLLESTLARDTALNQEEAFLDIYSKMRPGDPRILENAKSYFEGLFTSPRRFSLGKVGRYKLNRRLKLNFPAEEPYYLLQKEDLFKVLSELMHLYIDQDEGDNIDHLANRRIRSVGELVRQSFRIGLLRLERNIKERLSVSVMDKKLTPNILVNARPIVASFNEFFGSSQLSQYMDQSNMLSELQHLRRVSALGPGGLTRDRAGTAVRDVQSSHYARLCAIETPEGQNIGLNLSLATYTRVNEHGFLVAPYRRVVRKDGGHYLTDEIVYLDAAEEEEAYIGEATVRVDAKRKILDERIAVRHKGDFFIVEVKLVNFVDAHPAQMLGVSAHLIPFIASDAGQRALMGANMQRQAVPLIRPTASRVGTGLEGAVVKDAGRALFAQESGVVEDLDADQIKIKTKTGSQTYHLIKFMRTNENMCYNQAPIVNIGDKVVAGQPLVDGPSQEGGQLALGRDLLTAFMCWDGFAYEDSIVISDRLIKEDLLTSIHIKEYEALVMDTKLGPEEVTRDIPNVSEDNLRNLDETGIVVVGAEVKPGDILVGKIAPKGETELTAEERLLRAIFGEKAREVRDTSLVMPHGDYGVVVTVEILDKEKGDELGPGVLQMIKVKAAQKRKIQVGDKIAGRHGSKGVVAKVVREEDMPYLEDGTPIEIILNPISVLSRMNIGQLLETHLGWAAYKLDEYYSIPPFDRLQKDIIRKKLEEADLPVDGKVNLIDGRTGESYQEKIVVGYANIMKLHHLVKDKVHARSTGPYSLVTQQPLGGKAQMGGQRLGEMEVWALEAYGAAHILQEMLTIKSDDVVGRAKAFEAIIKGISIPEARVPEAFKLLVRELNSLGLAIDTLGNKEDLEKEVKKR